MDHFTALITDSLNTVELQSSLPLSDEALWQIAGIIEVDQQWPGAPTSGGTQVVAATTVQVVEPS